VCIHYLVLTRRNGLFSVITTAILTILSSEVRGPDLIVGDDGEVEHDTFSHPTGAPSVARWLRVSASAVHPLTPATIRQIEAP
jgi:hypothetical protein